MSPAIVAIVIAGAAIVSVAIGQFARGPRRLLVQRLGLYATIPSITAALVLVPLYYRLSFSDGLSLAGLIVGVGLALGAPALARLVLGLRIGVVIPSRVPFHSELRAGFSEAMAATHFEVHDDYLITERAIENLAEFLPALRRTLSWRPDYLVICSPSGPLVSSPQMMALLTSFTRKGGGIVFIDNEPANDVRKRLGRRSGYVTSDVTTGARIIADYVQAQIKPDDRILVLCGPPSSAPAELRRATFAAVLPRATLVIADPGGWTSEAAYQGTLAHCADGTPFGFVICGNDTMAMGTVRALRELGRRPGCAHFRQTKVIGYDGISRALYAIAESENQFAATIRTPPSAYGHEIAAMIVTDSNLLRARSGLSECVIPVGPGQLITSSNVEMVLEG
jgi:ABC-type sugar transport system substrate-binding protein